MFPFQVSSSYFEPQMSSSYSTSSGSAATCSDSESSLSTTFAENTSTISCFFDPSTCKYQNFSIPEKIVYYIAKNCTNGKTFQKLVETCKYFFNINPVIVVPQIECDYDTWDACYDEDGDYRVEIKYRQIINFKLWVTEKFVCFYGKASRVIPWIYKNDAKSVLLRRQPLKLDEFLFLAGNAEELSIWEQSVKNENGEIIQLEDIIKRLPKLKKLNYHQYFDGSDINSETVRKLMEIEHVKHLSHLNLYNVSEKLDVEEMFKYICENQQTEVDLWYRRAISNAYEQRVQEYSNRLKNEAGCNLSIQHNSVETGANIELLIASLEDDSSDTSFDNFDNDDASSDVDENEDFLFPWNNEVDEEWELPWNID